MITQSNPVLFVMMGDTAALAPTLTRLLAAYRMGAADCVIVPDADFSHLRAEINRIQQDFLQYRYTTVGLARVCYVLHDAGFLLPLRTHVEAVVSPLYPSGLLTDVYWLTDESGTLERDIADRANSMAVLQDALPDAQTYLLSNLNSESRHTPWEEVLHTVTLLTLFKDGEPPQYPVSPDASRYNEYLFKQNTEQFTGRKPFFTAGSAQLQVPQKALRALVMAALLSPLPVAAPPAPIVPLAQSTPASYEEEFIEGLALPVEAPQLITEGMPIRTILARLFGTRLGAITDAHPPATDENDLRALEQSMDDFCLYEAIDLTAPAGAWQTFINRAITDTQTQMDDAQAALDAWLDTRQSLKALKTDRRPLSFYFKQTLYPYKLAAQYLKRTAAQRAYVAQLEKHQALLTFVQKLHKKLEERAAMVQDVCRAYEADARGLTPAGTPLGGTSDYFVKLFTRHVRANVAAIRTLTRPLRTEIPQKELETYVENKLLPDPEFTRSFPELLAHIADDEAVTHWASAVRHTHIRLRSDALYTETNLHLSAERAADVKARYEALHPGRTNLFADSDADRISVLYHAGAFAPEDIYYAELYKGSAHENLQAKKPPRPRLRSNKLPLADRPAQ